MKLSLRCRASGRTLFAAMLLVVVVPVGLATSASAHARLVSISPGAGTTVTTPPTQVVVTFDDTVAPGLSVVAVKSASGALVSQGEPAEAKGVVTQPLVADLPGGTYTIAWKVVSDDGHPVSGTSTFTVQTSELTPLASSASSSSSSSPTSSAVPSPSSSVPAGVPSGGLSGGAQGALYVLALAAVIYGVLGISRARRKQKAAQHGDDA